MPPRQRRRRLRLARDPRLLRRRHPDRPDRHAQGNQDVSNIHYFGEPVYTYSLRRASTTASSPPTRSSASTSTRTCGWRPTRARPTSTANLIEDRIYNQKDFDRSLVLEKRTELVAGKITEFLKATDRFAKTIVFCEDIDHAERMRQALVNANPDLPPRTAST
jgi:type I restriction enzyme R subunit